MCKTTACKYSVFSKQVYEQINDQMNKLMDKLMDVQLLQMDGQIDGGMIVNGRRMMNT